MILSFGAFYFSTWEEYETGILYFGYISGPSEGAWILVVCCLVSGIYGSKFWTELKISYLQNYTISQLVGFIFGIGSILTILQKYNFQKEFFNFCLV